MVTAAQLCRSSCPGERECPCECHDAAERVRALLRERFGFLELERYGVAAERVS